MKEVRTKLSERPQIDADAFAAAYFPEDQRSVAVSLVDLTQKYSRADIRGLNPNDRFVEDFRMDDLDSMSLLELLIEVEKTFKIHISDYRATKIRTFRQLVEEVCASRKSGDSI